MEFSFKDIAKGREAHIARSCSGVISAHRTAFCQSPGEHPDGETGAKHSMAGGMLPAAERGSRPGGACPARGGGRADAGSPPPAW